MREISNARSYFNQFAPLLENFPFEYVDRAAELLLRAYEEGRTLYLFGNGGSASLASHLACDLAKGTVTNSNKRLRAIALTDNIPLMTAWANDTHYENIFAEQLTNLIRPGDVTFAISASGNSPNILKALEVSRNAAAVTIGLTGYRGGKMKELCDLCIVIPSDNMQIIEDFHLCTGHALFSTIRHRAFNLSSLAVGSTR